MSKIVSSKLFRAHMKMQWGCRLRSFPSLLAMLTAIVVSEAGATGVQAMLYVCL